MKYTDLMLALQIFEKYEPSGELVICYCGCNKKIGIPDCVVSEEDESILKSLGWYLDDISPPYNRIHAYHWVYR